MPSYLLILGIFVFRLVDVAVETIRLTFIINHRNLLASIIAFFEVTAFTWVFASGVLQHTHWLVFVAWGAGFACGQYIGGTLGHRLNTHLDRGRLK
jgi:uncharacterized protein YebE (UPF0316 family)